jgi:hypothetical protein
MDSLLDKAILAVQNSEIAYSKFLAANDTKATNTHQSGYLIGKSAWQMFLDKIPEKGENITIDVEVNWQDSFTTQSKFTYYGASKDEFRLTVFGNNFPFREAENVGDLLVLAKVGKGKFSAFILSHDEQIDDFFALLNISPTDTNKIIPKQLEPSGESKLNECFLSFLHSLEIDFPSTLDLAAAARNCCNHSFQISKRDVISNPDKTILNWLDSEFQLFKLIEADRYSQYVQAPFRTLEKLIATAQTILQRRKSRAGKSLELHLSEIFRIFDLSFETQKVTEDNKKPDFVFPNIEAYLNPNFDPRKLVVLASKTTCKDRWRQILNEADRVEVIYLFTLQQGISPKQLEEMKKYNVQLIVPKIFIQHFPAEHQNSILTLEQFLVYVKSIHSD